MKLIKRLSLFLMLLTAGSLTLADSTVSVPGIDANNALWVTAMNHGLNNEDLKELYTNDAVVVSPGQDILAETDFTEFLNNYIRNHMLDFQLQPINLHIEGDKAYQSAVWIATISEKGRESEIDGELTSIYLRQSDGNWKIIFQTWN